MAAKESKAGSNRPKFVYAHFMMPHYPHLFDSSGNFRDLINYKAFDHETAYYLNSVRYTNRRLNQLVSAIQQNSNGKAVIIAMGDHGYRSDSTIQKHDYFSNV
ncbi:MAG TPA: sulfatase-like hydrolase/transferase [Flavitalea sp.]|nr:sulfatase-like hydrolase/transferase [Flavitalea sp.]